MRFDDANSDQRKGNLSHPTFSYKPLDDNCSIALFAEQVNIFVDYDVESIIYSHPYKYLPNK